MRDSLTNERLLRRIEVLSGVLSVGLSLGALLLVSASSALGVFLGSAISVTSFQVLKWQLRRAFDNQAGVPSQAGLFAGYYARFLGTMFLVFTVMYYGWTDPFSLLAGLSVIVVSVTVSGILEYLAISTGKGG